MHEIDSLKNPRGELEINSLKRIIPYDYPFLLIDKVTALEKKRLTAIKNTSANEEFFKGHFKGFPIMPGALIMEGMGQAATVLIRYNLDNHQDFDILAFEIDDARFSLPTFPGDQLRYELELKGMKEKGALVKAHAFVADDEVAKAKLKLAIVSRSRFRSRITPGGGGGGGGS